jgi:hypothetical protein
MVEQERVCCPFLTFRLIRCSAGVTVTITALESARDAVNALFGIFLPGAPERLP